MTTTSNDLEIRSYVAAVAARLADLPADERDDLMADLEQHLHEVAAEGDGTLTERLGSPERYAAELRTSAGLPPVTEETRTRTTLRERFARVAATPAARKVAELWREVRPGWWIVRAGILTLAFVTAAIQALTMEQLVLYSVVSFPAFAAASWLLGRAASLHGLARRGSMLVNIVAVIAGLTFLGNLEQRFRPVYYTSVETPAYLHHERGDPISNICAYDSKLRPIEGILLFDQSGKPISNVAAPWSAEVQQTARGFGNEYPREHWGLDPGTGKQVPHDFECPTLKSSSKDKTKS